jgi:hypothetical protein
MKKFLSILAIAAVFAACKNEEAAPATGDSTKTGDSTQTAPAPAVNDSTKAGDSTKVADSTKK